MLGYPSGYTWHPGIGDPTLKGWVLTLGYFLAMTLSIWTGIRQYQAEKTRKETNFSFSLAWYWWGMAFFLFIAGVNKQLDFQTEFILWAKAMAKQGGWYTCCRRKVQVAFIAALGTGTFLVSGALTWKVYKRMRAGTVQHPGALLLATLGTVFILFFILLRAASFHHVDRIMALRFSGFYAADWLEAGGILLVILAGTRALQLSFRSSRNEDK